MARIPILGALDDGARRLLAFSSETRILRVGDVLFREGERASCAYFLLTGSILLDGGPTRQDGPVVVQPGVLLGETALLRDTVRPATAIAQEPSTALRIGRTLFLRVLREHKDSADKIEGFLKERLRAKLAHLLD